MLSQTIGRAMYVVTMYIFMYVCIFTCVRAYGYGVIYLFIDSNEFTDYFGVASAIDYTPGT